MFIHCLKVKFNIEIQFTESTEESIIVCSSIQPYGHYVQKCVRIPKKVSALRISVRDQKKKGLEKAKLQKFGS